MNQCSPRVSIGLPVYNGEKHLRMALESVLTQTFTDFEVIISDNASTDRTEQICREFADKDERIRYYQQRQNFGAVRNFNLVFELSTGEYFKWMGCDDWLHPDFLARCVKELDKDPSLVLCYSCEEYYTRDVKFLCSLGSAHNVVSNKACRRFHHMMWTRSLVDPTYAVIRRTALEKTGLISTLLQADDILALELCLLGKFRGISEYLSFRIAQPKTDQERMARIQLNPKPIRLQFLKTCLQLSRIIRVGGISTLEKALLLADLLIFFMCCQAFKRLFHTAIGRVCPKPLHNYVQGVGQ